MNDVRGIALMYHYIRDRDQGCPAGIRPLWTDEFEAQLDWLCERFDILNARQLQDVLAGILTPRRPFCVLTFDDGTKDHATVATPILAARGLCGFFFLLVGPWLDGRLPAAHRLHVLLSHVPAKELWQAVAELGSGHALGSVEEARRIYSYEDDVDRMRVKYAINFALPEEVAQCIGQKLIAQHLGSEAALAQQWFVTPQEAVGMQKAGMVIGTHGRNHLAIGKLSPDQAEQKVRTCHATLTQVLPEAPRWYAYPFGGEGARQDTLARADTVLQCLGYHGVFIYTGSAKARLSIEGKGLAHLDRCDCIRFPPRAPCPL